MTLNADTGCDTESWYPSPSGNRSPLKAGEILRVGSGDEKGLFFEWNRTSLLESLFFGQKPREKIELSYLKVFATTELTDFSSLMQGFRSSAEERVRELNVEPVEPDPVHDDDDMDIVGGNVKFGGGLVSRTTLRFTIVRTLI